MSSRDGFTVCENLRATWKRSQLRASWALDWWYSRAWRSTWRVAATSEIKQSMPPPLDSLNSFLGFLEHSRYPNMVRELVAWELVKWSMSHQLKRKGRDPESIWMKESRQGIWTAKKKREGYMLERGEVGVASLGILAS